ncbi:MAG: LacI family DNA-binding transcriptional regulator [Pleomorphochaeta sp.]
MTIKEIAKIANVSQMTVSNVINKRYSKVSKQTIEKVNKIIKETNYIPNRIARNLSAQSSKIIAIIVPLVYNNESFFSDPYTAQLVGILENNLRKKGYYAMIRSINTIEDTINFLNSWNVDGAIFIFPKSDIDINKLLDKVTTEIVFFDSYQSCEKALMININDYKGTYLATKYLINKGHKEIAFVSASKDTKLIQLRYNGYKDAMLENGLTLNKSNIFETKISFVDGIDIGKQISEHNNITAAITTADIVAIGIIEGTRLSGLRIPEDISLIGFDNLTISNYCYPKLTTINQNIAKKGEMAITLLLDKIEKINELPNKILIDVDLIERQSVISKI